MSCGNGMEYIWLVCVFVCLFVCVFVCMFVCLFVGVGMVEVGTSESGCSGAQPDGRCVCLH